MADFCSNVMILHFSMLYVYMNDGEIKLLTGICDMTKLWYANCTPTENPTLEKNKHEYCIKWCL